MAEAESNFQPTNSTLVVEKQDSTYYVRQNQKIGEILHFIISQAVRLVGAEKGAIYLMDENGALQRYGNPNYPEISDRIARHSFKYKRNFLLKKNSRFRNGGGRLPCSYIACFLGQGAGILDLGAFILEDIKHFENFSKTDFELISYFASTLGLLLRDSVISETSQEIFNSLTTSILLLLDNSNIHHKNNRLEYQLKEIIRVSGLINSSLELNQLLESIMESAKAVFRTEGSSLMLVDPKKEYLYFQVVTGEKKEEIQKIKVPMGQGIAGTVAVTRKPMIINDAINDPRVFRGVDEASNFVTRNILAAPLIVEDEVIGIIEAINTIDRNHFTQAELDLFLSFSSACALAIQKTKLLGNLEATNKTLQEKLRTLGSLFELGQAVLESHTEVDLIKRANKIIATEMEASITVTMILDPKKQQIDVISLENGKCEIQKSHLVRKSVILESINHNKIVLEESKETLFEDELDKKFLKGSYILLPLSISNENPFGILVVSGKLDGGDFKESHLMLLKTISSQIIKGYENLKLNQEMISKKAIEKELEITRDIQTNILPKVKKATSNFDLGVKSVPAKEVSGDFFDIHEYNDGQYSFLVADVSGKSLPAAIFMAISSSIIRTLARNHTLLPDEILSQANSLIYEDSQAGMFVTLFYVHYDPLKRIINYASAGHNDQILIRKDNNYELIKGKGAPLGVLPVGQYIGGEIKVEPGDILVLYTDGAIEEKNSKEEEFGLERFIQEIIHRKSLPSQRIIDELYELIVEYADGAEQFDDFTVMILKFNDDFPVQRRFPAQTTQIPYLREFLEKTLQGRGIPEMIMEDILLACDEVATNIVIHSYRGTQLTKPEFLCQLKMDNDEIIIQFLDEGIEFKRENVLPPSIEANLKGERKGGFGVYLVEKLMDSVFYERRENLNIMTISKRLRGD